MLKNNNLPFTPQHSNESRHLQICTLSHFHINAIVILVILLCTFDLSAQDFKQTLTNLRQEYEKIEKLHVVMTIQAFEDSLSHKPFYDEKADIKRDGKNYLYRFGNNEMLMNSKYLVVVDKSSREIVCSKRDLKGEEKFFDKDPIKMNMDSMLNLFSVPYFLGRNNNIDHYKVLQKEGVITRIDMMIDTQANVFQSMQYYYKDGQYVKIDFEVFDKQPVFNAGTFDESIFMTFVKGKLKAAQGYQQYSILEVKN